MNTRNSKLLENSTHQQSLAPIDVTKAVSSAVIISILLICGGIWNGIDTSKLSKKNTETSLTLHKLSNDLRFYEEAMSNAVNMALATGEPDWEASYENSAQKILETIEQAQISETAQVLTNMQNSLAAIIKVERHLFTMINEDNYSAAFDYISTDTYQELKIEQAQNALSLRAALDKRSQVAITSIQSRLRNTNLLFVLQFLILCGIWAFVIRIVRNWHQQQAKYNENLTTLAHYDALTGIGNRALFHIKLESAIEQSRRTKRPFALLLMDIDHFKDINDNLGHNTGDELLINVARTLKNAIRASDTVARLGGDEFAIIATNLDDKEDGAILAKKVLGTFEKTKYVNEHTITTSTSIGIAFYPGDATSQSELFRKSDMALHEAKRAGRANYKYFDIAIELEARERVELKLDLEQAIKENAFELYYQPLIDLQTNRVVSVEALMRWRHPTKGFIAPSQFIPVAEASQLIIPVGKWVTKTACLQQAAWKESHLPPINMAVNLSAVQFKEPDLIENIKKIINETGISPKCLTLEITESTIMETGVDVIQQLTALNNLGVKLAIDDFGTGYSSLAYLKQFPIHYLKIDRAFVQDLPEDKDDCAITRAIIGMARELNLSVVAEGIETAEQLAYLTKEGCNFGQGFHIGRPMPRHEFEQWYSHFLSDKTLSIAVDNSNREKNDENRHTPSSKVKDK